VRAADVTALLRLAWTAAYWQDFFSTQGVVVSVANPHAHVGQVLGLEAAGGVAIAYQYSASNLIAPSLQLSSGEHIRTVLSERFEELWRALELPGAVYARTGPIGAADAAPGGPMWARAMAGRQRMAQAGARFVVAYFDENSADRWDLPCPNSDAAADYAALLAWLRDDPSLGLVMKVKKSYNLFDRLGPVADDLRAAVASGRCALLGAETLYSDVFPTEAALMADVCIGKLVGTTAALEAHPAGRPVILVDTEGYRDHPFYRWGEGSVVFPSWEQARAAVEQRRRDQSAGAGFADWSSGIAVLDPYDDGQGADRLSRVVLAAWRALAAGGTRDEALREAERISAQFADERRRSAQPAAESQVAA
jgi:hypothetical protein